MIFTNFPGSFCCLGERENCFSCRCMYGSFSHRINVRVLTPAAAANSDLNIALILRTSSLERDHHVIIFRERPNEPP